MTTVIVIAVVVAFVLVWLKISWQDRKIATLYAHHQRLATRIEEYRRQAVSHARTQQLAKEISELKSAHRPAS
jgi:hypothetical protein